MGMACSDNDEELIREHGRRRHLASRPKVSYEQRERWTDEDKAYYQREVADWAEGFDAYETYHFDQR